MKLNESNNKYHSIIFSWIVPLIAVIVAGSLSGIGISFRSIPSFLMHITFYILLFFFIKWFINVRTKATTEQIRQIDQDITDTDDEITTLYFEVISKRAQEQRARWKKNIKKWLGLGKE